MFTEIEVLQLDFRFLVGKERWIAESFWKWPTDVNVLMNLAMAVRMSFCREAQALLVVNDISRFKVEGQRYTLKGPLALKMIRHIEGAVLGITPVFNLKPIIEDRFALGEEGNRG